MFSNSVMFPILCKMYFLYMLNLTEGRFGRSVWKEGKCDRDLRAYIKLIRDDTSLLG